MPTSSAEGRDQQAHLRLTGVTAGYGTAPVIEDVSLTVALGEVATVIGPNGAGKSTLLKTVLGILRPSSGEITLAGGRITGLPARTRNCFGVSAPKRLPEPAATRMAAMRMAAHCRPTPPRQIEASCHPSNGASQAARPDRCVIGFTTVAS